MLKGWSGKGLKESDDDWGPVAVFDLIKNPRHQIQVIVWRQS